MKPEELTRYQERIKSLSDFELLFVIANCTEELMDRERAKRKVNK